MVTIILLVSRPQYLKRVFARLEFLSCNAEQTNLLTYVDGDMQLFVEARNLTQGSKFNQKLCIYRRKGKPNVGSVTRRRERIADIHNEIKAELGPSDYLFLLEDDTLIPEHALETLMGIASLRRDIGIVSGVELGRWGYNHIGAWRVDDIYDPKVLKTIPKEEGVQPVDATGLYCCLVRSELYFSHHFAPFNKALGPDVDFGIELRRQGFKNYVDFTVPCVHMKINEDLRIAGSRIDIVTIENVHGKWLQSGKEDSSGRNV